MRKTLERMLEILKEPDNWTKGALGKNSDGSGATVLEACKFCLMGAIYKSGISNWDDARLVEKYLLGFLDAKIKNLADYNDLKTTKHEDIINLLERGLAGLK